jgi:hypothetical protein
MINRSTALCQWVSNLYNENTKTIKIVDKSKGLPQQTEVDQEVQGRLRPRIFLVFDTTRVVVVKHYAPAAFTLGEMLVLIFRV